MDIVAEKDKNSKASDHKQTPAKLYPANVDNHWN
jgi:hypothetical protein